MFKNRKFWCFLIILIFSISALAGCNSGSKTIEYPTKPINLIVPYAPGGSSDLSARPFADKLKDLLGQPVVVVNKAGAGGSVGAAEVARSKGDGYTLLNASIGPITIVPYTTDVGYYYDNFKPVSQMTDIPLAIAVQGNSPIKDLKGFIEYAKENPGKIRIGNPGAGNIQHVACEYFCKLAGIEVTNMPFEGANPAVAALLGGHVEAVFTGVTEVTPHYKSGAFRILAVTSEKRMETMPDAPTFKEQGYDVLFGVWYGVLAPKDTPDEVVVKLAEALKKAASDEKVLDAWDKLFLIPAYLGPQEFQARIKRDAETNKKVLEEIGLAKK